jgi:hypothetical protein
MQSEFVGTVPIDPVLGELLGTGSLLKVTETSFLTPYYYAALSKQFERGSATVNAGRGSTVGNGVLLAGVQDHVMAGYSRTFNSRIGASWFASYNRLSGRVATLQISQIVQTGGMLSIRIYRSVSFTTQAGLRYQTLSSTPRRRDVFAGVGLAWSPGSNPFIF